MDEPLILASASPIRNKLLATTGLKVRVEPALVDEEAIKRVFQGDRQAAAECALALAEAKARQVAERHRHALVVGADQILVCGEIWLSKPADLADARAQLQALRGRTHELVTAACVVRKAARIWHTVRSAKLTYAALQ
jgi:septum formation protein